MMTALQTTSSQSIMNEIATLLNADMREVESRISSCLSSDAKQISEISTYLLAQGGKRIRPLLALLSSKLSGLSQPNAALIDIAAGIELIHMATLLHDDIIDQSPVRRHKKSAYAEYGMMPSLLTGDFLLVRAFGLCAKLDPEIVRATERACVELTEGEILEGFLNPGREVSLAEYVDIVAKKTASLFALACFSGCHTAGGSKADQENFKKFGHYSGIAFQMVDDILDVTSSADLLGKPSGTDLKQKTPSLVNVLWLKSGETKARDFFAQDEITEEQRIAVVTYLRDSEIIEKAKSIAQEYAGKALEALSDINSGNQKVRLLLENLLNFTLNRVA
ncbi:polyprenyl synthetase family protein [bacterium]|nr:polyprenyl synthetase family protein [bacterium]